MNTTETKVQTTTSGTVVRGPFQSERAAVKAALKIPAKEGRRVVVVHSRTTVHFEECWHVAVEQMTVLS